MYYNTSWFNDDILLGRNTLEISHRGFSLKENGVAQ